MAKTNRVTWMAPVAARYLVILRALQWPALLELSTYATERIMSFEALTSRLILCRLLQVLVLLCYMMELVQGLRFTLLKVSTSLRVKISCWWLIGRVISSEKCLYQSVSFKPLVAMVPLGLWTVLGQLLNFLSPCQFELPLTAPTQ